MQILNPTLWKVGLKSLTLHPLRSLLTILGIFIGIASVIWLLAIGEGISNKVQRQIESLGTNNIILRSMMPVSENGGAQGGMAIYGITRDDYSEILSAMPTVDRALQIRDARREMRYGEVEMSIHCIGCTPEYNEVMQLGVKQGRFLEQVDLDRDDNVCVVSHELAQRISPLSSPVGLVLSIRSTPYRIVGVAQPKGMMAAVGSSLEAQDFTDDIYIPITTFWRRIGDWTMEVSAGTRRNEVVQISQVTFRVREMSQVLNTSRAIQSIMKRRHAEVDWAVVTPLELLEQAKTTRLMFMAFMGLIAAISLIVGGIGIMNIMLATVTERTREIGIRRALGANRAAIIRQFLVETMGLSIFGGLSGILGGLLCPVIITWLRDVIKEFAPGAFASLPPAVSDIQPIIVPMSIPLAFGIAVTVGIVFGIYPAIRAAQLDPIEALRHE